MELLGTLTDLDRYLQRRAGVHGHVLVPTMGALHAGHAALIRRAVREAQERALPAGCIVWVFVNPTQFNNPADLARYPRTLEADAKMCRESGAAAVFAPAAEEIYPPGMPIAPPPLPSVATTPGLEDRFRPGHFAGVCQVVKRFFEICKPAAAVFGEKDWQQLAVVRAMVEQEKMGIEILPEPTVREEGGLALSSRNVFLTPADRVRALAISRALRAAGEEKTPSAAEARLRSVLGEAGITPEYCAVRDAATLLEVQPGRPGRALIAAMVGSVRLIDNAAWN